MNEEQDAVARLRRGEISGLETLVRLYYFPAVRTAYLILRDQAQAEDVVQSVLLGLKEKIGQYDPNRPFRAWFLRCVVNAAINSTRKESRLVSLDRVEEAGSFDAEQWLDSQPPLPDALLEAQELQAAVWQALEKLTPAQRAAIVMRYYLGLNQAEMVERMNTSPSTIKWRLHSARQRLQELLAPWQPSQPQGSELPDSLHRSDGD